MAGVVDRTGLFALHDRRIPGRKANIDHIVVGPAAVYVVDAKNYNRGRLWAGDHALQIGGRDETELVRKTLWQAKRVREALSNLGLEAPVAAVLCFTGSSSPRGPGRPQGVHVITPGALPHLLLSPGCLTDSRMALDVADAVAWLFPPA